jgi:hypothetical protein
VSIGSVALNSSVSLEPSPPNLPRQPTSSKPPVSDQRIQNDVAELRQALGSGDPESASRAYTRLQSDLRNAPAPADAGIDLYG